MHFAGGKFKSLFCCSRRFTVFESRKEPPESAKRNKIRGEISRKDGVNCSDPAAGPRSGANKPGYIEPVRTILKKSEGCLRHQSCCPTKTGAQASDGNGTNLQASKDCDAVRQGAN